jgi:hypothetical protein
MSEKKVDLGIDLVLDGHVYLQEGDQLIEIDGQTVLGILSNAIEDAVKALETYPDLLPVQKKVKPVKKAKKAKKTRNAKV